MQNLELAKMLDLSELWNKVSIYLYILVSWSHPRFLPSQTREEGESEDAYAKRVQELMAKELNIDPTPYTNADKSEYVKRKLHIPPRIQGEAIQKDKKLFPEWV